MNWFRLSNPVRLTDKETVMVSLSVFYALLI